MKLSRDDLLRILRDEKWPPERRVAAGREILNRGRDQTDQEHIAYEYALFMSDAAYARQMVEETLERQRDTYLERLRELSDEQLAELTAILRRTFTDRQ